MPIINRDELLAHGSSELRRIAIDIIDYSLEAMDTFKLVTQRISLEKNILKVNSILYDLDQINSVYVIGAGKGVIGIAEGLENILGNRITDGVIIEKKGQGHRLRRMKVVEAGHPVPDKNSLRGAKEVVKIANCAKKEDLVLVCITGGCSSLMTLPPDDISLEDIVSITHLLLMCGADIQEINTVRKHISAIMGGKLALLIHPAKIINLLIIDEVLGLPWGPTIPDTTTFRDAVYILKKYNLWDNISSIIKKHLEKMDPKHETPKIQDFQRMDIQFQNVILANVDKMCTTIEKRGDKLGLNTMIFTTTLEGESKDVASVFASIAKEIDTKMRPCKPPCILIAGGETTVTITGEHGKGGRNQELVLAAACKIDGYKNIVIVSLGTDGTDGPTDIAGGIVDGYTFQRAQERGIDIPTNLGNHNSSYVLTRLGDAVFTGPTGTNVMDIILIIIGYEKNT